MNLGEYSTPIASSSRFKSSLARSTASKRDSLEAELERDPQLATAKRQQRTKAFATQMSQAALERQLLAVQTAKGELESKLREKELLIERLEGDRQWLAQREKEEREEKERERTAYEDEKRKSDSDLRALRNSFVALREQHNDLEDAHATLSRNTAHTIASQKSEITSLTREVQMLKEELAEFKNIAESRSHNIEELQAQLNEMSVDQDTVSRRSGDDENWEIVRDELHRQSNHVRTLESANTRMKTELAVLRQRHENIEILKEQKRELERKARDADELRERVVRLEAELDASRSERQEWATKASTPVSVTKSLSELRLTYARLLEEHGSTAASLRRREVELTDAEQRVTEAQDIIDKLRTEIDNLKERAERNEHRAQLAERDAGFLKAMVASFNAEEASQEHVNIDQMTAGRVQHLEALLADYQTTIGRLEKEIEALRGDAITVNDSRTRPELVQELTNTRDALVKAEEALHATEAESEKGLERIEELEQTLFELRGEIGAGRHLPPGVRVLSMRQNPAQEWEDLSRAAMDRLKGENEALLKRLKDLESSGAVSGSANSNDGFVPRESWEGLHQEKEELEDSLKQMEKRLMRLKQIFSAKTDEFKEAIAAILGVKLAFYPNGQVRVTSQFDLNAAFVFQPAGKNEGMTMQLVAQGDGGPEELPQLMRYWVEQEQCIPGFLASVTLECYEKNKSNQATS